MITTLAAFALAIAGVVWIAAVVMIFLRHRQARRSRQAWHPSGSTPR